MSCGLCSTPSGIKGRNAANTEISRDARSLCSTPSGIKGRNARRHALASLQCGEMLNAFRHQRKKRCSVFSFQFSVRTHAQRLPASKEETPVGPGHRVAGDPNAQRLPASKEETLLRRHGVAAFGLCSTPSGIKGRNAPHLRDNEPGLARMLNAFRHQRKKREQDAADVREGVGCSTPSGIKGRNASRLRSLA